MPQYNFVSPGAMGANAIEKMLMERAMLEMEQAQSAQGITSQQAAIRQRDEEMKRRQEEMQMQAELQNKQFESLDEDRVERRMNTADANAMRMRDSEADRLARAEQAQMAIMARSQEGEANRQAQAERASESNELRRTLGIMAQGNRQGNQDLQRELLQGRIDAQTEKTTQANNARDQARAQAHQSTQGTLDLIDKLIDTDKATGKAKLKPQTENIFGLRIPHVIAGNLPLGNMGTNALSDLNRLKGEAIVGLISEMKRQSATGATGFGALSQRELDILNQSATTLANANISDEAAAEELGRLRAKVQEIQNRVNGVGSAPIAPVSSHGTAAPAAPAARQKWGRDASGKPVRIQ